MVERVWYVGSNELTASQIEIGFQDALAQLDEHLSTRPYLFGGRPAFGDFGLWGQLYELWTDPTAGALIVYWVGSTAARDRMSRVSSPLSASSCV